MAAPLGVAGTLLGEDLETEAAEQPIAVRRRQPNEPTLEEIAQHYTCHEPYRDWCPHCVRGRGRSDRHFAKSHEHDALACIGIDYGYLGAELEATPLLCGKDQKQRWFHAIALPSKGVGDWSCKSFTELLRVAGHSRMVLRSDSEPSIVAFKTEVARLLSSKYGQEVLPENALTGAASSASNGLAEHAVNEIKSKVRCLKSALETFLKITVPSSHPSLTWLVSWAAITMNLFRRGPDGRTAWELRHGRSFNRQVCVFGEHLLWMAPGTRQGIESKWNHGCFLGFAILSNCAIVSDMKGDAYTSRTLRRLPPSQACDPELFLKIRATPWSPVGASRQRCLIDAPPLAFDAVPRLSRKLVMLRMRLRGCIFVVTLSCRSLGRLKVVLGVVLISLVLVQQLIVMLVVKESRIR